jgi:hypothetical protein
VVRGRAAAAEAPAEAAAAAPTDDAGPDARGCVGGRIRVASSEGGCVGPVRETEAKGVRTAGLVGGVADSWDRVRSLRVWSVEELLQ